MLIRLGPPPSLRPRRFGSGGFFVSGGPVVRWLGVGVVGLRRSVGLGWGPAPAPSAGGWGWGEGWGCRPAGERVRAGRYSALSSPLPLFPPYDPISLKWSFSEGMFALGMGGGGGGYPSKLVTVAKEGGGGQLKILNLFLKSNDLEIEFLDRFLGFVFPIDWLIFGQINKQMVFHPLQYVVLNL